MPVRNAAPWLPEALDSIRGQTLRDLEIVAVDDGSTDESRAILEAAARKDPRIRVRETGAAPGLVSALNRGVAESRAPLVARMDADDVSTPDRLEKQVALLARRPDLAGVSSRVEIFTAEGEVRDGTLRYEAWLNSLSTPEQISRERFVESPLPHPSVVVRRRVLLDAGGYRDVDGPEDYDLWLRLLGSGHRFAKVERVLLRWRDHPRRASRTDLRYSRDRFLGTKARALDRDVLSAGSPWVLWGAGPTGRKLARLLEHWHHRPEVVVDIDPRKIGRSRRGRPVIAPDELERRLARGSVERSDETRRALVLVAVARWGARDLIRDRLDRMQLQEGVDYWCLA